MKVKYPCKSQNTETHSKIMAFGINHGTHGTCWKSRLPRFCDFLLSQVRMNIEARGAGVGFWGRGSQPPPQQLGGLGAL